MSEYAERSSQYNWEEDESIESVSKCTIVGTDQAKCSPIFVGRRDDISTMMRNVSFFSLFLFIFFLSSLFSLSLLFTHSPFSVVMTECGTLDCITGSYFLKNIELGWFLWVHFHSELTNNWPWCAGDHTFCLMQLWMINSRATKITPSMWGWSGNQTCDLGPQGR